MSKRIDITRNAHLRFNVPESALERWHPGIKTLAYAVKAEDEVATLNIFEEIGERWDGSGMTAKRVAGILRTLNKKDVVVNINSPGGDFFEGVAIYNMLREYEGSITTRIPGLAASAASIIAMAGDRVEIAASAFMMIHNSWSVVMGNRNDLSDAAETLAKFDAAMAQVYKEKTGLALSKINSMMDADTFLSGEECLAMGFCDSLLAADMVEEDEDAEPVAAKALERLEAVLASAGLSRSQRRELIGAIQPPAVAAREPDAVAQESMQAALEMIEYFKTPTQEI